jgi:Sec-independent protein translocase protein TatA
MGPDILIVLIIVLIAVLLWRGPKNLPKLGEAFGRGVREAKNEATQVQADIQRRTSDSGPESDADGDKPA